MLKPGGRLIASVNHPFAENLWHREADLKPDHFATYNYVVEWTVGGKTARLRFWTRPLHAMTDAFTAAGFRISVISEPAIAADTPQELLSDAKRISAASRTCSVAISGHAYRSPGEVFADLAFFPSGIMAQQVALRIHTDRAGNRRVAMPDLSHLLVHEEDGPRLLHGLEISLLTRGYEAPAAAHLEAVAGRLGAVLVELPLRDAGCLLPAWDDLVALSAACRARGAALHFDAARIWESQPWFGHPLSEIAALDDSLYVSFYKGLGGLAGAAVTRPQRATPGEAEADRAVGRRDGRRLDR